MRHVLENIYEPRDACDQEVQNDIPCTQVHN